MVQPANIGSATTMGTRLRLLMVEDSEEDAHLLVRELKRAGYDVAHERVDTATALEAALDRQTWDVVVGDYSMPQFSGTAALAIIQQHGLDLPFISVSGTISEEMAVAAMRAGAKDYVTKGQLKRLVPAIERELREAGARAAQRTTEASYATLVASRSSSAFVPCATRAVRWSFTRHLSATSRINADCNSSSPRRRRWRQ